MKLFRTPATPGSVTVIPQGRLASRLRAVASAVDLYREAEKPVEIVWFESEDFNAPHERLFTLSPKYVPPHITLREGRWYERLTNDLPGKNNLYASAPFVFVRYDLVLRGERERLRDVPGKDWRADLLTLSSKPGERVLLSADSSISVKSHLIYRYLEPTVEVLGVRNSRMSGWGSNVVGIHLSRPRGQESFAESPTELYIRRMQRMIEEDPTTTFFLATTDDDEQERLQTIFRNRVFAFRSISEPGSPESIIEAFGELLALSSTRMILTTPHSTFSEVAAEMGHIPVEQLSLFNL